jgi:outer membrane immunogenic protein
MHFVRLTLLMLFVTLPWTLNAQATPSGLAAGDVPRLEVGLNYNYIHANAPPGECGCFGLNGGSGTVIFNLRPSWSVMADLMLGHANNVSNADHTTTQNITIFNYLFGPRYTRRRSSRFVPYGEVLLGGAREDVNFDFTINRNAFGLLAGGGVTTTIKPKIGFTIVEADWIYTRIPNAVNDRQNDVRISTGLTYRFGVN